MCQDNNKSVEHIQHEATREEQCVLDASLDDKCQIHVLLLDMIPTGLLYKRFDFKTNSLEV